MKNVLTFNQFNENVIDSIKNVFKTKESIKVPFQFEGKNIEELYEKYNVDKLNKIDEKLIINTLDKSIYLKINDKIINNFNTRLYQDELERMGDVYANDDNSVIMMLKKSFMSYNYFIYTKISDDYYLLVILDITNAVNINTYAYKLDGIDELKESIEMINDVKKNNLKIIY